MICSESTTEMELQVYQLGWTYESGRFTRVAYQGFVKWLRFDSLSVGSIFNRCRSGGLCSLGIGWIFHFLRHKQFDRQLIDNILTHWGRATHICVSEMIIIGSDNGLSPGQRQAIISTNVGILLIGPLGMNSSEILSKHFHSRKCIWKCRLRNGAYFVSASMC